MTWSNTVTWWEARPCRAHWGSRWRPRGFETEHRAPWLLGPIKDQRAGWFKGVSRNLVPCTCDWVRFPSAFLDYKQVRAWVCISPPEESSLLGCWLPDSVHSLDFCFSSHTISARLLLLKMILPFFLVNTTVIYQIFVCLWLSRILSISLPTSSPSFFGENTRFHGVCRRAASSTHFLCRHRLWKLIEPGVIPQLDVTGILSNYEQGRRNLRGQMDQMW